MTELSLSNLEVRGYLLVEQGETFPDLYTSEEVKTGDKEVVAHFFLGSSSWWLVEADLSTGVAFGYCLLSGNLTDAEWGYFSLNELEDLRIVKPQPSGEGVFVWLVERDKEWVSAPAREVLPSEAWAWADKQKDDEPV